MDFSESDHFREIFYKHYSGVRRKLVALVREEAAADDLAQEVFLRLYRNPPDDPAVIGAWLHRVLTRIGYDHLAKRARERTLQSKQEQLAAVEPNSQSNEEILVRRLEQEEVRKWLDDLPERDRKVLLLRYSGYSYNEIAEQLQVRAPLVGTLLQRASTKLKRQAVAQPQTERHESKKEEISNVFNQ